MMNRYAFLALTLLSVAVCHATVTTAAGTIVLMRDLTLLQPDGRLQGVVQLQLSVPLSNGCNWVWIGATDKGALATALAAKASGATITISYDNAVVAPWGQTDICGLMYMDIQ